ncbi:MAG: ECF-type sigma factor [Planctomycetota bacterium]
MANSDGDDATQVRESLDLADGKAADRLLPMVYDQLRRLASQRLGPAARSGGLEPTEIVHEAFVRLQGPTPMDWAGRTHFLAVSARAMRRVLADYARKLRAGKRGGGAQAVTLDEAVAPSQDREVDVLELEDALARLRALSERQAEVVVLRFFGGLSIEECAEVLGVSRRTVLGDWSMARAWLRRELTRESA